MPKEGSGWGSRCKVPFFSPFEPIYFANRINNLNYTGRLLDGTVFDSSDPDECTAAGLQWHEPLNYIVGKMSLIPGWEQGVMDQPEGTSLRIVMPSALGYGPQGAGQQIPPYSPLVFDIDILSVK